MDKKFNWLQHLDDSIPSSAYGYKLCIYSIALEGWRRGLRLKFFNVFRKDRGTTKLTVRFSLSYNGKEHKFAVSRGDLVSKQAISICVDKDKTKEYLLKANVSVPEGKSFGSSSSNEEIVEYFKTLNYPVVLKPTDAGGGKGVITNITNIVELEEALNLVRTELQYKDVILEKYIQGEDHRIYVIGDNVIGVYKRIAANVIGDGEKNIDELIDIKNKERKKNPYLFGRLIKKDKEMDNFLKARGLTLKSVPKKGDRVFLREKGSLSAGGEPIDVTDKIPNHIKKTAIDAARAIPGLPQCAVDMIIDKESNIGVVNEVNSKPQISNHLYPVEGYARDIPKAIIDYYFPETIKESRKDCFYFDFDNFLPLLINGFVEEVVVPCVPKGEIVKKKLTVSGSLPAIGYKKWIKKAAHSLRLNGFVESPKTGKLIVVVAGEKESINKFKTKLQTQSPVELDKLNITEEEWGKTIKIGFEIINNSEKGNIDVYKNELKLLKRTNFKLKKSIKEIEKEKDSIRRSTSWRLTKPIRIAGDIFKVKK
nr:acylphosphatase [Evansella caseinilytica]